jgi:hypothetical protein
MDLGQNTIRHFIKISGHFLIKAKQKGNLIKLPF